MVKFSKANCPICNSTIKPITEKNTEIVVCPFCQNSLFMYKGKKDTKVLPFALDSLVKSNKFAFEQELEDSFEDFDDDEEIG